MSKKNDDFQFNITLGDFIICQRDFTVERYVEKSFNSVDLYEYIRDVCDEISLELKNRTAYYLLQNEIYLTDEIKAEDEDFFLVQVKKGDKVIIQRMIPTKFYHPKARYINIKPLLSGILYNLTNIFSNKNVVTNYLNYQLV